MSSKPKNPKNDIVKVRVDDNAIFDPSISEWLIECVSEYGDQWAWSYRWGGLNSSPVDSNDRINIHVTVEFADERYADLFIMRWSTRCITPEDPFE